MNPSGCRLHLFETDELLPETWRSSGTEGPVRTFNPGLLPLGDGWLLAYRMVLPDGRRRIAMCRLDGHWNVVPGSAVPVTDRVRFAADADYPEIVRQWFADPRLYRFGDALFMYWNSGWHEPRNWQFLQQLDPMSLEPIGAPRELVLRGERRKLEKNWTFFQAPNDGRWLALYSILPHRVLTFSLQGDGPIFFEDVAGVDWALHSYPASHGGLRGGAPPIWSEDRFWVFCHSVHDGVNGYRYAPAVYCFGNGPGFAPVAQPMRPLEINLPAAAARRYPALNPAVSEVVYPCGASRVEEQWLISVGINDERCGLVLAPAADVAATLTPMGNAEG